MKAMDKERQTRRKIIRQWMALPKEKRQTAEQVESFAASAVQQGAFTNSRRAPHTKVVSWLLPRRSQS